ncbi:tryptophanyl-tRNA synthetase [Jaminaea rosea]|uniref:tryptophan--tRNA ligase n=1 Tax=Jaminaea rosea TaxID=1569628 RepID=A0A316UIE3_9BASI|nr:tryptophanyl-tRNA synthetase [Jaminaea rosea]PWN25107.1 tryptophanyl-tRNA synthetase [Jaminaea rosea]
MAMHRSRPVSSLQRCATSQPPARNRSIASSSHASASRSSSSSPPTFPPHSRAFPQRDQPTGTPHLGNLLGALFNWKRLLEQAPSTSFTAAKRHFFSIVGLHALTVPQDPDRLRQERSDMLAALLAVGIDPSRCVLFHQESVPEHAELMWLLGSLTSVGRLKRMTTWKGKVAALNEGSSKDEGADLGEEAHLPFGLFAYPVLQAADILLYGATHVPVGQDQAQHLELARELAQTWNRRFSPTRLDFSLRVPQTLFTPTMARVLSLRDPTVKMSKSSPDAGGRILLDDGPKEVEKKVKRAVTDDERSMSFEVERRPGVANLLGIIAALESLRAGSEVRPESVADRLNTQHASGEPGAKMLKDLAGATIVETLEPIRQQYERLRQDRGYLAEVASRGRDEAREVASKTMLKVRAAMGIGE